MAECCGTCKHSSYTKEQGWVCTNAESEYVADFTEYSHTCDSYEKKDRNRKRGK